MGCFVGLLKDDPYEVFALKSKNITLPEKIKSGQLIRIKNGVYKFISDDGLILEDITELFERDEEEALTRMISWGLRHGGQIQYAIEGLNKSEGTIVSFNKAIARALKRYIPISKTEEMCPECETGKLIHSEGCIRCLSCNYAKCE